MEENVGVRCGRIICKGLYEGVQASVQVDGQQSRWFRVEEGLRQGCPLSPLLYSIYIMEMVEELERESLGVKVSGVWCGALLYANDIMLIAEAGEELQKICRNVEVQVQCKEE